MENDILKEPALQNPIADVLLHTEQRKAACSGLLDPRYVAEIGMGQLQEDFDHPFLGHGCPILGGDGHVPQDTGRPALGVWVCFSILAEEPIRVRVSVRARVRVRVRGPRRGAS